jgi:hypothetical protein
MKTTLIKKLKLALIAIVVTDIFTLIFEYRIIYLGAFALGGSTYNLIGLVLKHIH